MTYQKFRLVSTLLNVILRFILTTHLYLPKSPTITTNGNSKESPKDLRFHPNPRSIRSERKLKVMFTLLTLELMLLTPNLICTLLLMLKPTKLSPLISAVQQTTMPFAIVINMVLIALV